MKAIKKSFILLIVSVATIGITNAQGVYVNLGLGYNLNAAKQVVGNNGTRNTIANSSTMENVTGSYGKGFGFGLGLGYLFTENVGAEAAFSMVFGSKYKTTYSDDQGSTGNGEVKGRIMRITPALKVTGGEKLKPYAKFGLVIGMGAKGEVTYNETGVGYTLKVTEKYSGGTSIGWMGAFGVDFELSDMLGIFLELNSFNQTWAPEKNEWSISQTSGNFSESESGTQTFVDKLSGTQSQSTIFGIDNQELKDYNPFSSFGIHVGAKLAFGGSK